MHQESDSLHADALFWASELPKTIARHSQTLLQRSDVRPIKLNCALPTIYLTTNKQECHRLHSIWILVF
jgi:hypothetical protein